MLTAFLLRDIRYPKETSPIKPLKETKFAKFVFKSELDIATAIAAIFEIIMILL